ncbi:MAG: (2Fe-2S)-binding protein [Terriglobia bacterium]|nr:(2Fe-2S)-binding protein [Terriglobia bacterium]
MPELIEIKVDGTPVRVPAGASVASAILDSGTVTLRHSVSGEPRGAVCGMGVCFECRVTVNGVPHVRSCMTLCEPGMDIRTK